MAWNLKYLGQRICITHLHSSILSPDYVCVHYFSIFTKLSWEKCSRICHLHFIHDDHWGSLMVGTSPKWHKKAVPVTVCCWALCLCPRLSLYRRHCIAKSFLKLFSNEKIHRPRQTAPWLFFILATEQSLL